MAEVIRMPRMSDTMEEGVIVGWMVNVGDTVEPGDVLAEVETDKATMELESYHEGVLLYIGVKEGPVPVNGVLAVIGEEGEDYEAALAAESTASNSNDQPKEPVKEVAPEPAIAATVSSPEPSESRRIKASPLAKSMAIDAGLNLANIKGSGDQGRIVKKDVEAALASGAPAIQPAAPATSSNGTSPAPTVPTFNIGGEDTYEDTMLSQMRKTIARRLGESKFTAPHFYLTIEANMGKAIEARKEMNEISTTRISFNDIVVKACAVALRQHPAINSSWLGDRIRKNNSINIGVAVAVEDGLLVPVIRHADMKSLSQIDLEVRDKAGRAKERKLGLEEMQGNTFTVSNLGMFGIEEFTAIINPPDSCILAVGSILEKPVVIDGELAVGNMMRMTLSCDHRVVDGATGAQFLETLKSILEEPIRLLV